MSGMPPDVRQVYMTWLLHDESYQRTAEVYGVRRESVYKRITRYLVKLERGCTCVTWRCWCDEGKTSK